MDKEIVPRTFLKETIQLKVETEAAFLELAARLYRIHQEEIWKSEYDSYEEFLMDARISKATSSKLESIHEVLVMTHKIPLKKLAEIGWSSLYTISRHADTKARAEELVDRATDLKRGDLEESLRLENSAGKKCDHEWVNYKFCTKCGVKHRIYD